MDGVVLATLAFAGDSSARLPLRGAPAEDETRAPVGGRSAHAPLLHSSEAAATR
jgi:hypothetical protein